MLKNDGKQKALQGHKSKKQDHTLNPHSKLTSYGPQGPHFLPPITAAPHSYPHNFNDENVSRNDYELNSLPTNSHLETHAPKKIRSVPTAGESIKVAIRPRPLLSFELQRGDYSCVSLLPENTIELSKFGEKKQFKFDFVLSSQSNQEEAFQTLEMESLLDAAFEGYSSTIIAYGQTGSGKTYTFFN